MKRIWMVLLAVLLLAACGAQKSEPTAVTTVPPTTAPAETAAPLGVGETVDNETIAVTLAAVDPENRWGYTLTLNVKNKTDRALKVVLKSLTVNDCVSHKQWETELPALTTVESTLSIADDSYMLGGTEQPEKLELVLTVWEGETELPEAGLWAVFYPNGLQNWAAEPFAAGEAQVLVDNEQLTVAVLDYDPADPLGYGVLFYLENKTASDLLFDIGEAKVDNSPCQPLFAGTVPAGKRSYAVASWYLADLQSLEIDAPSKLELPFAVYDLDDYLKAPLLEETFELFPVWE